MADNVFKKYRARIAREGILKAILLSACIGLAVLSVTVLVSWFCGFKPGFWIGLGLFALCVGVLAPVFYIKFYRPTAKAIARRVDELGLEERVLTMVELQNDPSYMAMCQREDALKALSTVNHMLVKVAIGAALIIPFSVGLVIGTSSTVVGALYTADVIPSGIELVTPDVLPNTYTISYSVGNGGGGSIVMYTDDWTSEKSVSEQFIVTEGEDAPAVLAVEDENYIFIGWSDGITEAYRQDVDVKGNMELRAVFLKTVETVEDPERQNFETPQIYKEPSDRDDENNTPPDPDAPPWPPEQSDPGTSEGNPDGTGGSGPGAATQNDDGNQIIDGQTFYGDTYEDAHNSAMDRLGSDDAMDDSMKEGVSQYFDSIQQDSSKTGDGEGEGTGSDSGSENGN